MPGAFSTTPSPAPDHATPATSSTSSSRRARQRTDDLPHRDDVESILIIGSGPIVIGQAAEFDYSGTQACRALKDEGYRVILVNSNPATIMTDPELADATYVEPLTAETAAEIIRRERPDALLPTLGGQTALNLAREIGFPLIIRPSFTLGGKGGATAHDFEDLRSAIIDGLDASPVRSVLVERSVIGWKEFELEVMRDLADNVVVICSIEN